MEQVQRCCGECEEVIPAGRVKVLPNVRYCIRCQEDRHKNGDFVKSRIEFRCEISGWQFEGVEQAIISGDE